jgi:hypothetical protein
MATPFSSVIDLAIMSIQDYKLNKLFKTNTEAFDDITNAFLIKGVPKFTNCRSALTYDLDKHEFASDLSPLELSILSDLWVYEWFNWHVQNVTQFENSMTPSDFKHHSKAENLKQKSEHLDRLREKYSQKMVDYGLTNLDSSLW